MFTANFKSLTSVYTGEGRVLCCALQLPGGRGKVQVIMMKLIIRPVVTRVMCCCISIITATTVNLKIYSAHHTIIMM